jgi:hypothetical protein
MPSRCKSRTLKAGAPVSLVYRFTEHCAPVTDLRPISTRRCIRGQ